MAEKSGFSFSSIIMSYCLIAGGCVLAWVLVALLKINLKSEASFYAIWGLGAVIGGFIAGRASQGETVLEPAIGAALLAATFIGIILATDAGQFFWHLAPSEFKKFGGILGGCMFAGGILGAFVSEKLLGESTTSGWPWILYVAVASLGAVFMAMLIGGVLVGKGADTAAADHKRSMAMLIGFLLGSLVTGATASSSSRVRIHGPVFLGSAAGFMGFAVLLAKIVESMGATMEKGEKSDFFAGAAVLALGAAIVAVIGSLVGWAAFGKKNAS
jgi:hypothetical protein